MLAAGMRGVLLGKRREVAVQEANRLVELARSLSYDEVGLASDDPTIDTDPAIVDRDGRKSYLVDAATGTYEPILFAATAANHPFNPHTTAVDRGATQLTNAVYVTGVDTDGDGGFDMKRVLVRVEWREDGSRGAVNEVRSQSFVDESGLVNPPGGPSPSSCPSGDPSCSGVGNLPIEVSALTSAGTISARSDRGDLVNLVDAVLPTTPVVAGLPVSRGESVLRGVSDITCTTESFSLQDPSGAQYGTETVTVSADDDGVTAKPEDPPDRSWSGSFAVTGSDAVDELVTETSLGGSISCHASASDSDGALPTDDGLPYERGRATGPSGVTMTEDVSGAGLTSDTLTVLSLGASSVDQSIDYLLTSGRRDVASTASGSFGGATMLSEPGAMPNGLVRVGAFDYSASATASDGTPSSPQVSVPGGITIEVFDPEGDIASGTCTSRTGDYCTITYDPLAGGVSASAQGVVTADLGLTKLIYDIDVQGFPAPAVTDGAIGANGERHWSAEYTGLQISTRLQVEVTVDEILGTTVLLTDSLVDLNLGKVSASGCAGVGC